jgi:transposase
MKLRVIYAKRKYKGKTYTTPLVVTSYRDAGGVPRHKTVINLSALPSFLVSLIEKGLKLGDVDVLHQYGLIADFKYLTSLVIGPAYVVFQLLKELEIIVILKTFLTKTQVMIICALIIERVTHGKPLSVSALCRRFTKEASFHLLRASQSPELKTWYRSLGALEQNREAILKELFKKHQRPGELYLYDITSTYFEGEKCLLAEWGYNRDGKKGKKIIVIGLICDEQGCPIWIEVFKGSTSDQTTVLKQFKTLQEELGIEEFTFVGDRGMLTKGRIDELEERGWLERFRYITAITRKEMMQLVEDINHPIQLSLFDERDLAEVEHGGVRYILCHNPLKRQEDRATRERLLEKTEQKLFMIQKNVAAGNWKSKDVIAKRLYRWGNHWGMEKFFNVEYDEGWFSYRKDEEKIQQYTKLDGCYVIRSNVDKKKLNRKQLLCRYKDLKMVEQAFRTMKTTELQVRPVRHWTPVNVRGHVFMCFLAYRIIWEVRQRLAPLLMRDEETRQCEAGSLTEIWRELSTISVGMLNVKDKIIYQLSRICPESQKILDLLQIESIEQIVK